MSTSSNPFARVLSIRSDKRRPRSQKPGNPIEYHGLFTLPDNRKKPTKEEEKKIAELSHRLTALGLHDVSDARIEYALRAKHVDGDVNEAFKLLMVFEDSVSGVLREYNPSIKLLGAENREKTTCYLDALLFSMFAREDVFETVLLKSFRDEPRQRLVLVLRLWVNMVRAGRLITTDITQHLQEVLAACGWADAASIRQQDASEAFGFIMDKLEMPLVTLKTDIYHAGKEDATDDHKFITERLLEVAIPEDVPKDEKITLEMCLEEYFNNRIEVKRAIQRRTTMQNPVPMTTSQRSSIDKGGAVFVESVEVESTDETPTPSELNNKLLQRPGLSLRNRTPSIFSDRKVEIDGQLTDNSSKTRSGRNRAASVKKEVLMPAWQFLNLIPWYTDNSVKDDKEFAAHLASKRPMLGICLKRYGMNAKGYPMRLDTHIDIPLEIVPPYFEDEGDLSGNYKLVLQAVVCHRGSSIHSGHYISLVRAGSSGRRRSDDLASSTGSESPDVQPDTWLRSDDLAQDRIIQTDIRKALLEESPYLLFYRIQPVHEEAVDDVPPAYEEAELALSSPSLDEKLRGIPESRRTSFEIVDWASRRASMERNSRDGQESRTSFSDGRRASIPTISYAPSLTMDQIPTEPTTPLEEGKRSSFMVSRQTTNKSAKTGLQTFGDLSGKRFSLSMSKITSRLGGDKTTNPEIVVDEVSDESPVSQSIPEEVLSSSPEEQRVKSPPAKAEKEKKKKTFKTMSRRGSGGHGHHHGLKKSKEDDRECILM